MPKCASNGIDFGKLGHRATEADFSGGDPSSDGRLMLSGRVDRRIGLPRLATGKLSDPRDPGRSNGPGLGLPAKHRTKPSQRFPLW